MLHSEYDFLYILRSNTHEFNVVQVSTESETMIHQCHKVTGE